MPPGAGHIMIFVWNVDTVARGHSGILLVGQLGDAMIRLKRYLSLAAVLALGTLVSSCGSDDLDVAAIPRIHDPGKTFDITALQDVGFKKSKTYDVEGLIGADSAYYGFWALDPYAREDYEVRFFPSHSDAIDLGTAQADERSGEDAILDEDAMSWPEGVKDARQCSGGKSGQVSHSIQNCDSPKYWDYSIYGNMILLCSGGEVETARKLCNDLLVQLDPPPE